MLTDRIENVIDAIVRNWPCPWQVYSLWHHHIFYHTHVQVRAKFIQDNCDGMTQDQWFAWFETLSTREFIHCMLLDDPTKDPEIKDAVSQVLERLEPPDV